MFHVSCPRSYVDHHGDVPDELVAHVVEVEAGTITEGKRSPGKATPSLMFQ